MSYPHLPDSTTVSLIALLISCGTTFVTYIRTYKQDIHDNRKELRELLKRIVEIPREQLEVSQKYEGKDGLILAFNKICNEENSLLARQAAQIARRLKSKQERSMASRFKGASSGQVPPSKYISATEYLTIGFALFRAYNVREAMEFLQYAVKSCVDFNDEVAALRNLAYIYFYLGRADDGRDQYRAANQIFGKYRDYDSSVQTKVTIETELSWAQTELGSNFSSYANEHLRRAEELIASMPAVALSNDTLAMLEQTRQQFQRVSCSGQTHITPPLQSSSVTQIASSLGTQ